MQPLQAEAGIRSLLGHRGRTGSRAALVVRPPRGGTARPTGHRVCRSRERARRRMARRHCCRTGRRSCARQQIPASGHQPGAAPCCFVLGLRRNDDSAQLPGSFRLSASDASTTIVVIRSVPCFDANWMQRPPNAPSCGTQHHTIGRVIEQSEAIRPPARPDPPEESILVGPLIVQLTTAGRARGGHVRDSAQPTTTDRGSRSLRGNSWSTSSLLDAPRHYGLSVARNRCENVDLGINAFAGHVSRRPGDADAGHHRKGDWRVHTA